MALLQRYVRRSSLGGDGTTDTDSGPNAAFADIQTGVSAGAGIATGADEWRLTCTEASSPDTTPVVVSGYAAGSKVSIHVDPAVRHNGTPGTGYLLSIPTFTFQSALDFQHDNWEVIGLEMDENTTGQYVFVSNGTGVVNGLVDKCLIHNPANQYGMGFNSAAAAGSVVNVRNTIVFDCASGGIQCAGSGSNYTLYLYNVKVIDCATLNLSAGSFVNTVGTMITKNCEAQNPTTTLGAGQVHYSGAGGTGSTNNLSGDATAPGTAPQPNATVVYVNAAAKNFLLSPSDTAAATNGTSLAGDANFPFSDDILGTTRGATWDIGAHQVTTGPVAGNVADVLGRQAATVGSSIVIPGSG